MEFVHPETGRKQRVPWDRGRAEVKLEEFRAEAKEHFRQRDIQRAKAVGIQIDDASGSLPTCKFDDQGNFSIDVLASSVKHSGAEFDDYWVPKWQEFCSRPQNDEGADYPVMTYRPRAIAVPVENTTRTMQQVQEERKRRPGRPRKEEMANV
jgi:hypothetical protein